ncbi:hypothetical protein ACM9HF_20110 [Colwellia sp. RE-S-Sl-9]
MSYMINIVCALGGALFGSWIGHKFTISFFNSRTKKQKIALYDEVQIINEDYINWLNILIDEFNEPLKDSYSGAPFIHTKLLDNLVVELSSTDEMLTKNQRRLLVGLSNKNRALAVKDNERDLCINDLRTKSDQLDDRERFRATKNIEFWTAHLLREVIEIIFYTSKLNEESNNFIFGKYEIIEQIKAVCKYSNLDFDEQFWQKVIQRISA